MEQRQAACVCGRGVSTDDPATWANWWADHYKVCDGAAEGLVTRETA